MVARGDAPGACKAALLDHLRAWSSQRFVVDCGNMVFLLCLDDTVQSVGCLSLLKQADGHYRLCDTERTSDFPGLFYDDKFCRNLREKLLLIP
jgi:hypothetical protein